MTWISGNRSQAGQRFETRIETPNISRAINFAEALDARLEVVSPTPLQQAVIHQLLQSAPDTVLSLARFQAEAVERQLFNLLQSRSRGVEIGAGTGAGKTKAFYIPAFAHIAESIDLQQTYLQAGTGSPHELLKDQLAEAFAEVCKLDRLLTQRGKRPIPIRATLGIRRKQRISCSCRQLLGAFTRWSGLCLPLFHLRKRPQPYACMEISDIEAEIAANKRGRFGEHTRLRCTSCNFETVPWQLALNVVSRCAKLPLYLVYVHLRCSIAG